ncbi:MAG: hypothetical protein IPI67_33275 [Myxococcales bacterium]|nr:hypothetical protein [Myxococcales bacterium]
MLLSVVTACGGNSDQGLSNLQLWSDDQLRWGRLSTTGRTFVYDKDALTAVADTQLEALTARYGADTRNTEVVYFVDDPHDLHLPLGKSDLGNTTAYDQARHRAPGLGVPHPSPFSQTPPAASDLASFNLDPYWFDGAGEALRGARVMDHGFCSADIAYGGNSRRDGAADGGLLWEIGNRLFDELSLGSALWDFISSGWNSATYVHGYMHVPAYVAGGPLGVFDQRGGFFVDLSFDLDPSFGADIAIKTRYRYAFTLDSNSQLKIAKGVKENTLADCQGICSVPTPDVEDHIDESFGTDVPDELNAILRSCQRVPIPQSSGVDYFDCESVSDCAVAKFAVTALASQGGQVLGLSSAERVDVANTLNSDANWVCAKPPNDACPTSISGIAADQKICQVALKTKRLNFYPDAVELVWFDAGDRPTASPTYGVYLAAVQVEDTSVPASLCSVQTRPRVAFTKRYYGVCNL